MHTKKKYLILVVTLLGGLPAFPALANSEWSCRADGWFTPKGVSESFDASSAKLGLGGIFNGTHEQARQQMKDYLAKLDKHHVWKEDLANVTYTCIPLNKRYPY
ncbi:TPA: hypothetical protein ON189_004571 [Serratia marcescens]|nr:hypothetical protein [Serratia marcescens]